MCTFMCSRNTGVGKEGVGQARTRSSLRPKLAILDRFGPCLVPFGSKWLDFGRVENFFGFHPGKIGNFRPFWPKSGKMADFSGFFLVVDVSVWRPSAAREEYF